MIKRDHPPILKKKWIRNTNEIMPQESLRCIHIYIYIKLTIASYNLSSSLLIQYTPVKPHVAGHRFGPRGTPWVHHPQWHSWTAVPAKSARSSPGGPLGCQWERITPLKNTKWWRSFPKKNMECVESSFLRSKNRLFRFFFGTTRVIVHLKTAKLIKIRESHRGDTWSLVMPVT